MLKHDLGDEDGPGVCGFAPWIGFSVLSEPSEEGGSEGTHVFYGVTPSRGFVHEGENSKADDPECELLV